MINSLCSLCNYLSYYKCILIEYSVQSVFTLQRFALWNFTCIMKSYPLFGSSPKLAHLKSSDIFFKKLGPSKSKPSPESTSNTPSHITLLSDDNDAEDPDDLSNPNTIIFHSIPIKYASVHLNAPESINPWEKKIKAIKMFIFPLLFTECISVDLFFVFL